MISMPSLSDVPNYFHSYYKLIEGKDLLKELQHSQTHSTDLFESVPAEKENYRYQEGKWSIKQVLRHIIDCERIFSYRAFRFSRFDATELHGFDEDAYISNIQMQHVALADIVEEYKNLRKSSIELFKGMSEEMLDFKGRANKLEMTARGIGFLMLGHNLHHCHVVKESYLS